MPTALIKITQGATTDIPGRALVGALLGGTVVFENGDDTGVTAWKFQVLEVPPGSAIPLTLQDWSAVDTFTMASPDKPGSYRLKMWVRDAAGNEDVDIRVFAVPFTNLKHIAPPYQGSPPPLPLTGQGSKPDEMNFGGQLDGWGGDLTSTRKLMYQLVENVDQNGSIYLGTFPTTDATASQVAATIDFANMPNGDYLLDAEILAREATDHAAYSKRALFTVAAGSATQVGATQDVCPDIESAGAAGWVATLDASGGDVRYLVTGGAGDSITWTMYGRIRKTA